ncbi:MAG: hypothetical protein K0R17_1029 [Rariglobus sp.]|jgi:hypothetical protein|nr:hypothetical protein [Rariglobus sp.]
MKTTSQRGEITLATILVMACVGGALVWLAKPRKLDGESRRADASLEATAALQAAHKAELAAADAKAATVAASVQQIGVAAAAAPANSATDYIGREVTWLSPLLPAPDARALLAAERRRIAVMEGRLDEAQRLYATADKERAMLLARASQAEAARDVAQLARETADRKISEAAAANLALERRSRLQWAGLTIAVVVLGGGWLYAKIYGIGPATLGNIAADIRAGMPGIQAIDTHLAPRLHRSVQRAAKLATEIS